MKEEEKDLLSFNQQWDLAFETNDADKISSFMSDDWIITGPDGVTAKNIFMDWIRSGIVTHSRMDSDESIIRVYGNTGIVISRGTSEGTYYGKEFSLYEWSMSVFIKNADGWKCVSTMLTPAKMIKED